MSDERPVHERVHEESDPSELETVEELRFYARLQRDRGNEHFRHERAATDALNREQSLTDRFLKILEQVTARR